jgi:hypothetical protein
VIATKRDPTLIEPVVQMTKLTVTAIATILTLGAHAFGTPSLIVGTPALQTCLVIYLLAASCVA